MLIRSCDSQLDSHLERLSASVVARPRFEPAPGHHLIAAIFDFMIEFQDDCGAASSL
jgi:hypothetical protein